MLRRESGSISTSNDSCGGSRPRAERPLDGVAAGWRRDLLGVDRHGAGLDLRQVEDVADQVQQVGAGAVDGARELDLLGRQVAVRVFGELLAEDQDLLSGVRSSCDMLARNSDLYFEVSASSVAFSSSARRACSISWFLRSTSTFARRAAAPSARAARWSAAAPSAASAIRRRAAATASAAFGLHRRFDRVEHDADRVGELLEEGHLRGRERAERGQLDHRLDLALEQHRQHDDVRGRALNSAEPIGTASAACR
jgi:hypothetical protein